MSADPGGAGFARPQSGGAAPVRGLILAGGSSSRMQRDKAALVYRGISQLERTYELAARHLSEVCVSVRPGQVGDPVRSGHRLIVDAVEGEGPIVGIRSAFAAHPDCAWLVVACDLPFLSDAAFEQLLRERDPAALATAFKSAHDGLPEPLCAIWEPSAAPALERHQAEGSRCPRKFLIRNGARLLDPVDRRALDNVNTPEEYARASAALEESRAEALGGTRADAPASSRAGSSAEPPDGGPDGPPGRLSRKAAR